MPTCVSHTQGGALNTAQKASVSVDIIDFESFVTKTPS